MKNLYDTNGLVFWTDREIALREQFADYFRRELETALAKINPAWRNFHRTEAPILTPRGLINTNYTNADVWVQEGEDLVLRPKTTPGSYAYAAYLLKVHGGAVKPPFVVWQAGKSFRREQDQVTKNMRLKEFYQQEFQCVFTADTKNDYHLRSLEPVRRMIEDMVRLPTRLVESDRLPSYSRRTMDVEVSNGDKWMEVCSISLRSDFPEKVTFTNKKEGVVEKGLLVLEIAIGLDRCVYNFCKRRQYANSIPE